MRKDLMDILACPVCKVELRLEVKSAEGDEVMEGSLTCAKCGHVYPIEDSIPNLLPPDFGREEAATGA